MDPMFDDEFRGVGGSYVVDPKTGRRVPAGDYVAQLASAAGVISPPPLPPVDTTESGSTGSAKTKEA